MVATSATHLGEVNMDRSISRLGRWLVALGFGFASVTSIVSVEALEMCGSQPYPFPYTDVSGVGAAFCPGIMEAYVTGVSKGTTPTTFSPNNTVTRVGMTTFLQRSVDQVLTRGSRRAALNQWGLPQSANGLQRINIGGSPKSCAADGQAIWTTNYGQLVEVEAHTGTILNTWDGIYHSYGVVMASGLVWVSSSAYGELWFIDPTMGPSNSNFLLLSASDPRGVASDGTKVWMADYGPPGSVWIIEPWSPYTTVQVTTGFSQPFGILYDGAHIWITDQGTGTLLKLDASGTIVQTVAVGLAPRFPVFDGTNIWVPNGDDNSISIVQASTGNTVATITTDGANMLSQPSSASFDGERIMITNQGNNSVTLFKAADLSFIANVATGSSTLPLGACSDGINFWVPLDNTGYLLRF
jgi:hypothetical protein